MQCFAVRDRDGRMSFSGDDNSVRVIKVIKPCSVRLSRNGVTAANECERSEHDDRTQSHSNAPCRFQIMTAISRLRRVTWQSVKNAPPQLGVSRAILLCLGYGFFSLLATGFPVVVSQYFIPAQLTSPPCRSRRATLTHPAPRRHLASGGSGQKTIRNRAITRDHGASHL
jgi:hypothetical protein